MNLIRLIGAFILIALVSTANSMYGVTTRTAGRDRFVGTWELELIEIQQPNGEWEHLKDSRLGPDPIGIIIYDSAGNMAVQIMGNNRPSVDRSAIESGKATLEELQSVILGYTAYFGTYEVNEKEGYVVHHRRGHLGPTQVGTDAKRFFKFTGDRLILTPPPREVRLIWKRVNLTNRD
ncbi:MAG: hypothetical protein GTO16_05465 [Candidatus Aminicenantes bacterium]|nr:hypothetical protein [Candidatus Aminicenantes bacterium]